MGWRFRKSFKILPGVKLNLNKKSTSITFGGKGAHYTVNSKGTHTASAGIPGTGLYYTESVNKKKKGTVQPDIEQSTPSPKKKGCGTAIIGFICCIILVGALSSFGTKVPESSTKAIESTIESTESAPETTTMYATAGLNVRSGPGTEYDIISTLKPGTEITVLNEMDGWAEIEYSSPAFVSASYISSNPVETTEAKQEPMVWVSYTGKKYHSNPSCSGMKGPSQIPLSQAQQMGITPCSKCY